MRRLSSLVLLACLALLALGAGSSAADPNDPAWPGEWGLRVTRTSDLWQLTTGDPKTVIAVVDTGINPIPDPIQLVPGWNILGNDTSTGDSYGHGTWVSSMIGAAGDNGIGIAGYCWKCSLMPVRVAPGRVGGVAGTIGAGIRWAVDHGARIVNVSLVSNQFDFAQAGAIEYAQQAGVLVVASAGNGGDVDYRYPAAYPGVLSVAGTDERDLLEDWSTHGAWVNLAAPGCAMVIDANVPAEGCGSSFTSPAVSGIAGLLVSLNPSLTVSQLSDALRKSAVPVDGIGGGRVDAWAAAHFLGLAPAEPPTAGPSPPAATVPTPNVSRQVQLSTGTVRRQETIQMDVSSGRLAVQLTGQAAAECSLALRVKGEVYVGLAGERNVRSLAATVKTGRYAVTLSCATRRPKTYEVSATGMFPN